MCAISFSFAYISIKSQVRASWRPWFDCEEITQGLNHVVSCGIFSSLRGANSNPIRSQLESPLFTHVVRRKASLKAQCSHWTFFCFLHQSVDDEQQLLLLLKIRQKRDMRELLRKKRLTSQNWEFKSVLVSCTHVDLWCSFPCCLFIATFIESNTHFLRCLFVCLNSEQQSLRPCSSNYVVSCLKTSSLWNINETHPSMIINTWNQSSEVNVTRLALRRITYTRFGF